MSNFGIKKYCQISHVTLKSYIIPVQKCGYIPTYKIHQKSFNLKVVKLVTWPHKTQNQIFVDLNNYWSRVTSKSQFLIHFSDHTWPQKFSIKQLKIILENSNFRIWIFPNWSRDIQNHKLEFTFLITRPLHLILVYFRKFT